LHRPVLGVHGQGHHSFEGNLLVGVDPKEPLAKTGLCVVPVDVLTPIGAHTVFTNPVAVAVFVLAPSEQFHVLHAHTGGC